MSFFFGVLYLIDYFYSYLPKIELLDLYSLFGKFCENLSLAFRCPTASKLNSFSLWCSENLCDFKLIDSRVTCLRLFMILSKFIVIFDWFVSCVGLMPPAGSK